MSAKNYIFNLETTKIELHFAKSGLRCSDSQPAARTKNRIPMLMSLIEKLGVPDA